ncbi:hypothetical protein ACIBCB_37230 [Streptomyces uncialis]
MPDIAGKRTESSVTMPWACIARRQANARMTSSGSIGANGERRWLR